MISPGRAIMACHLMRLESGKQSNEDRKLFIQSRKYAMIRIEECVPSFSDLGGLAHWPEGVGGFISYSFSRRRLPDHHDGNVQKLCMARGSFSLCLSLEHCKSLTILHDTGSSARTRRVHGQDRRMISP